MPNWAAYERGIEALMNSLVPQSNGTEDSRKCLTLEDLLIKVFLQRLDETLDYN